MRSTQARPHASDDHERSLVRRTMPRTLFDKIWDFHRIGQRVDGRDLLYIDRHVLHELHAHLAFAQI